MYTKLKNWILHTKTHRNTLVGWVVAFFGVVLVRMFLELFSDPLPSGFIASSPQSILAVFFFYFSIAIGLGIIITLFTKQKGDTVLNLILYGLPIIWLAPIIDIIASKGTGYTMAYLFDSHLKLVSDFFLFFGPILNDGTGLTIGIHIELLIIMAGIIWYTWVTTKKKIVTALTGITSYTLIFIMLIFPGFLYSITHPTDPGGDSFYAIAFLAQAIQASNIPANTLHDSFSYANNSTLLGVGFDVAIAQMLLIVSFVFTLLWAYFSHKKTLIILLKNARWERVLFYLSLLGLGSALALFIYPVSIVWLDWVSVVCLAIAWFSAWMFSVHINDIEDIEIDAISNQERPLPKENLSRAAMQDTAFVWLGTSLVGSYLVGYYPFYMNIVFLVAYYIYSAPPLRLKRVPLLSSFLIAIAATATTLTGFFFFSPNKLIGAFPAFYAVGLLVVFTLAVNIRDIKDIEGDRVAGIPTLPVLFKNQGRRVVGVLLALSFLLAPFFFPFFFSYILSIPAAYIAYRVCVKTPYDEKKVFALYFAYYALSLLSVMLFL